MPSLMNDKFFCEHYSEIKKIFADSYFTSVRIAYFNREYCLFIDQSREHRSLEKRIVAEKEILKICDRNNVIATLLFSYIEVAPEIAINFDDWILLEAARQGDFELAQRAIANGADVGARAATSALCGFTPMFLAAAQNHMQLMEFLLTELSEKRKDLTISDLLDAQNSSGSTPLHIAAYLGQQEAVAWLLTHGARCDLINIEGKTAEQVATKGEIIQLIQSINHQQEEVAALPKP